MDTNLICCLCNCKITSGSRIVKEVGIANLIEASKKRKDKVHLHLENLKEVTVHKSCQSNYVNESRITASLRKSKNEKRKSIDLKASIENFDFEKCCFFCESDASDDYISKYNKRPTSTSYNRVHVVQQDRVKENILSIISERLNSQCRDDLANKHKLLKERIEKCNLTEVRARYHDQCYRSFYTYRPIGISGRPSNQSTSDAAEYLIDFLCSHCEEECQFSVSEILSDYQGESIENVRSLEFKLKNYFGDQINIIKIRKDLIICFQDGTNKILTNQWYQSKKSKPEEERKRIIETAGDIIFEEIKSTFYDVQNYPAPESFLDDAESAIPPSLMLILNTIINKTKKSCTPLEIEKWQKRIMTIAHIIIYATRPRSFLSPILLGISCMLHKKHASKNLIDCLAHIGLCNSYAETLLFEASIVSEPQNYDMSDSYIQCIFDNADHNTNTIDGRNTFHSMGGIMCATPAASTSCQKTIPRLKKLPSAATIGKFGFIPLQHFGKPKKSNLKDVIFQDLSIKENENSSDCDISASDILWFFGKYSQSTKVGGWNSFMEIITPVSRFEISKIIPLPFVNSIPSNYDTIFTVLVEANERCKAQNQSRIAVTFDQPLYQKAFEIMYCCKGTPIYSTIKLVFLRLGGFHLLMSYLGAIDKIMSDSGLLELFCEILAEASATKALTGHAYSRAIRAHFLIQAALAKVIISQIEISQECLESLKRMLENLKEESTPEILNCTELQKLTNSFLAKMVKLKENGPTAKLWIQYFNMVHLAKRFIQAERTGNFNEHLNCVQEMLPFFYASGHNLYSKSAHLYLQNMMKLADEMDADEFEKFSKLGFFTIRRKEKFRSGTWTDMIIEQVLMRSLKVSGGITHGRGLTDSVLCKWTLSSIVLIAVTEKIEEFCNVNYTSSYQHVDASNTRITRDESDMLKLNNYFSTHNPFPETNNIISISSGIVGDNSINCYKAEEVGKDAMSKICGKSLAEVTFSRKSKVVTLAAVNCIKVGEKLVNVDPAAIFQRAALSVESRSDMKIFLRYELSSYPMSLFDVGGFRKTQKSLFYCNFTKTTDCTPTTSDFYVIDGGFLLHKVRWNTKCTIEQIISTYVQYVKKNYKKAFIVFDGYSNICTKSSERARRQNKNLGVEIKFDRNTEISQAQDKFLNIDKNKERLIDILCQEFNANGYSTKIAKDDADCLIIEEAIKYSEEDTSCNTFVVGEDIDLLVILNERARKIGNLFLLKPGRVSEYTVYNSSSFQSADLQHLVGFIHAMSGCDTTSALFNQGKNKLITLLNNDDSLKSLAENFYLPNATAATIGRSGAKIIAHLYGAKNDTDLNNLRFLHFKKAAFNANVKLEKLPPTEGSAVQHSYRVYVQVQEWLGIKKDPTKWGWKFTGKSLEPIYSEEPMVPEELSRTISCKCKKGCKTKACTCRKNGFKCTDMCSYCSNDKCMNVKEAEDPANTYIFDELLNDNVDEENVDDEEKILDETLTGDLSCEELIYDSDSDMSESEDEVLQKSDIENYKSKSKKRKLV